MSRPEADDRRDGGEISERRWQLDRRDRCPEDCARAATDLGPRKLALGQPVASPPQKAGQSDHRRADYELQDVRRLATRRERGEHEPAWAECDRGPTEQGHGKDGEREHRNAVAPAFS